MVPIKPKIQVYKRVIGSHSLEQVVEVIRRLKNAGKTVNTVLLLFSGP
jgi:hypothetical protein